MCMTIKFRPKEHWKAITKNIDGKPAIGVCIEYEYNIRSLRVFD